MKPIELRNVSFRYQTAESPSVRDVCLAVEAGSVCAVIGAGGAGKTTICNLIRGFAPRFHRGELTGHVLVNGRSSAEADLGELGMEIGFVFQNPFVQISGATETVAEEVAFGLENLGVPVPEIRRRVEETLDLCAIDGLRDLNPMELSGGQKQRVAFASTVAMDPPIYVIDEPTSQLDPQGTEAVFAILGLLKDRGKTIVLVEHKLELIAEYADDVAVLDSGRLVLQGPPADILARPELDRYGLIPPAYAAVGRELHDRGFWDGPIPVTRQPAAEMMTEILAPRTARAGGCA
jgi:energy-coupling factor transport system ATP-binding protein